MICKREFKKLEQKQAQAQLQMQQMQAQLKKQIVSSNFRIRSQIKQKHHDPIRVLFVCHLPEVWSMFEYIYRAMDENPNFDPWIVAVPYAHATLSEGYHDAGMLEYCQNRNLKVICGYDRKNDQWVAPEQLHPDYIFFQTPYASYHAMWSAERVSMFARIVYLSYGPNISKGEIGDIVQPVNFFEHVNLFCAESDLKKELFKKKFHTFDWYQENRVIVTGYPKIDHYNESTINKKNLSWKRAVTDATKRILWSTRWGTEEGMCHFFDYRNFFTQFCEQHNEVDFLFRPHPLFWQNMEKSGELTAEEQNKMRQAYTSSPNMSIDQHHGCEDTFRTCDILISDFSGMLIEFFPSGKPIIYTHRKNIFNEYAEKMAEGLYWVNNEQELRETLHMLLNGEDPLKEKRDELMKQLYFQPPEGSGQRITDVLATDFFNE